MKNLKFKPYPVIFLVFLLGFVALGLKLFRFTISIEPHSTDTASLPVVEPPIVPIAEPASKISATLPSVTPALPTPAAAAFKSPQLMAVAVSQGNLRISNPTEHPVRVALLTRQLPEKTYGQPAHWDFSPMEGGSQGLKLSLPQGNLKLKKGDILVAFAQDGSRLYWGPFVVGETASPVWNQQQAEWQLVLQP